VWRWEKGSCRWVGVEKYKVRDVSDTIPTFLESDGKLVGDTVNLDVDMESP
jgi:hypothetical protein